MAAMRPMHEEMHQRARQQWQIDEHAQHMGAMLGEQKDAADGQKAEQYQQPDLLASTAALGRGNVPMDGQQQT